MNRFILLLAYVVWCLASICQAAGGGADYGRGPETDPIATPILSTATGNVATLQAQMTAVQNRTGTWNQAATDASSATGNVATLQSRLIAQADTNETTTATAYTPRFVGDVLLGGAGAGTNAVWIAKGATTNDWVAIKP